MKNKNYKFERVIMHFGADKTGSTSIQSACDSFRETLYQNGIYYPQGRWHAILGSYFSEKPENYILNVLARDKNRNLLRQRDALYLEELRIELADKNGDFLLFSYEGFSFLDEKELHKLRSFVLEYAEECIIIYYVRSPLSYAISCMSQSVKMGFKAWTQDNLPISKYSDILRRMCLVFGKDKINVRLFDRGTLLKGDIVLDFLSLFNLPSAVAQQIADSTPIENTKLSLEAMLIGEKIIDYVSSLNLTSNNFNLIYSEILNQIQGQKIRLTKEQTKEIVIASQTHTEYLKNEFNIIFPESIENSEYITTEESLSSQTIGSIAKLLIKFTTPETIIQNAKGTLRIMEFLENTLMTSSRVLISVQVSNNTDTKWKGSFFYPIYMSYHWLDVDGKVVIFEGERSLLPEKGIPERQTTIIPMMVVTPNKPGNYKLMLTILQENIRWFEEIEFEPCIIEVNVKSCAE